MKKNQDFEIFIFVEKSCDDEISAWRISYFKNIYFLWLSGIVFQIAVEVYKVFQGPNEQDILVECENIYFL